MDKIRSRRTHRKSRLGCGNCKKRRVKCDEGKPECRNCQQHSIHCDFQASRSPSEGSTPPQRFQFKQSKYSFAASPEETPNKETSNRSIGVQCTTPSLLPGDLKAGPSDGISLRDLRLFHHFTVATSLTLGDEPDPHQVWQVHVPQWGLSFRSILHLVLTLSALHLAFEDPDKQAGYIEQADEHFTFGVRSVTSVLALDTLDSSNCQQIYIAAVMICFAYFARGPRDGEYLVFNQRGKSEWLVLLHGVRAIMAQKHAEIFTGVLEPAKEKDDTVNSEPTLDPQFRTHTGLLQDLKQHLMALGAEADKDVYTHTVDDLIDSFNGANQTYRPGMSKTALMLFSMGWTFRLREEMIAKLESREPLALVILAYWAILLSYMDDVWFMRGWAVHIYSGIRDCLPGGYSNWTAWPGRVLCGDHVQ